MSLAKATDTIYANYTSQVNKPAGGFRLYYNPTVGGTTVNHASPSVPIGFSDHPGIIDDDLVNHRVIIKLPYLIPLIEITAGAPDRVVKMAIAPVDADGNVGDLSSTLDVTVTAPTFPVSYTLTT